MLRAILVSTAAAAAVTAGATGFGVNGHIPSEGSADRMVEAGIEWVRIDFLWSFVEVERDVYDWSVYDALLDRLEDRNLRVFAGLGATPGWATSGEPFNGVPDEPEQWREFCYLAAARYAGRIDAWGLWNEPNLDRFWAGSRQQYIDEILLPGIAAIRLADPATRISAPDLAHIGSANWDDWLEEVIAAAGDALDVVTHHVYPSYGWADTVTQDLQYGGPLPFSPPAVRDVLQDAGWWRRPFWLTETGVESADHGPSAQADFVRDLLRQWFGLDRRSRSWVDRIFFYEMHDAPSPSQYTWGLTHGPPDFEPKPAFWAYQQTIEDAYVMDAELVESKIPSSIVPGRTIDAALTFRNTGTLEWADYRNIALIVELEDPDWGVSVSQFVPGELVEPGQTHTFAVRLTAPDRDGQPEVLQDLFSARLDRENDAPFGDMLRHRVAVTKTPPPTVDGVSGSEWVATGRPATLVVEAGGGRPLAYRWFRNGVELVDGETFSGTTSDTLTVTATDGAVVEGSYFCLVSNDAGAVLSQSTPLRVGQPPPRNGGGRHEPGEPALRGARDTIPAAEAPSD